MHLSSWPKHDSDLVDAGLIAEMDLVRRLVSLGLAARNAAGIGVRQPLASAQFSLRDLPEGAVIERHRQLIKSELNLKSISVMGADEASRYEAATIYTLNPLPRYLGRKFGADFKAIQAALRDGEQDFVRPFAERLLAGQGITLELDGQSFDILNEECEVKVTVETPPGAVEDGGYVVALDTTLSPDLVEEGLARELIRRIQNLRKLADFALDDRIEIVYCDASDAIDAVMQLFGGYISSETLAETLQPGAPADDHQSENVEIRGEKVTIGVRLAR